MSGLEDRELEEASCLEFDLTFEWGPRHSEASTRRDLVPAIQWSTTFARADEWIFDSEVRSQEHRTSWTRAVQIGTISATFAGGAPNQR